MIDPEMLGTASNSERIQQLQSEPYQPEEPHFISNVKDFLGFQTTGSVISGEQRGAQVKGNSPKGTISAETDSIPLLPDGTHYLDLAFPSFREGVYADAEGAGGGREFDKGDIALGIDNIDDSNHGSDISIDLVDTFAKGLPTAGDIHYGDSDKDGYREYGFSAGPLKVKTEDPLRTLLDFQLGAPLNPLSPLLPGGNWTDALTPGSGPSPKKQASTIAKKPPALPGLSGGGGALVGIAGARRPATAGLAGAAHTSAGVAGAVAKSASAGRAGAAASAGTASSVPKRKSSALGGGIQSVAGARTGSAGKAMTAIPKSNRTTPKGALSKSVTSTLGKVAAAPSTSSGTVKRPTKSMI